MRILFASEYYHPYVHGGAEVSIANLFNALTSRGERVWILTPEYGLRRHGFEGEVFRFPFYKKLDHSNDQLTPIWFTNPLFLLLQTFWLCWLIVIKRIEIIHAHSLFSIPAVVIAGWLTGRSTVATFRDWQVLCNYGYCVQTRDGHACNLWQYFVEDFRHYYQDKVHHKNLITLFTQLCFAIYGRMQRDFILWFAHKLTAKICISQAQKEIYERNGFSDIKVIYNIAEFGKILSVIYPKKEILFQGRLTSGKGIDVFLKAAKIVIEKKPDIKFIVAGNGSRQSKNKNIKFLGWVAAEKMPKLYQQALLTVQPSVFLEPFGRGALESLVNGTPVVVSNRGGLSEIVKNGLTGFVTDPEPKSIAKAIELGIQNNLHLRSNIYREYPKLRKKFSIDPLNQHVRLYQHLI